MHYAKKVIIIFALIFLQNYSFSQDENEIFKDPNQTSENICVNIFGKNYCAIPFNRTESFSVIKKYGMFKTNIVDDVDTIESGVLSDISTVFIAINNNDRLFPSTRFCSGVIVSEHYIVTAAHCFFEEVNLVNNKTVSSLLIPALSSKTSDYVKIGIGNSIYDSNMKFIKTVKTYINPLYDPNSTGIPFGDIAIIKTEDSLTKLHLVPVPIAKSSIIAEKVWSVGFGITNSVDVSTFGVKKWIISRAGLAYNKYCYLNCESDNSELPNQSVSLSKDVKQFLRAQKKGYVDASDTPDFRNSFLIIYNTDLTSGQICSGDSGGPQFVKRDRRLAAVGVSEGFSRFLINPKIYEFLGNNKDLCQAKAAVSTKIYPYSAWINSIIEKR